MRDTNDSRLLDLVVRWEELRDAGDDVSLTEICAECPELLPALREQVAGLQAVDGALITRATHMTVRGNSPDTTVDSPRPTPSPGPVDSIPGYEVLRELGRGGMGVVYLARQAGVGRLVALKMLLAGAHASKSERARFETEVAAIGRLQHPNLVQVFEVNEHDGRAYFSMEYLEGGTLADKAGGRAQPPRQAAETVALLARAMQVAHLQGVIHRDLKPANVLLTAAGVPKIGDFGLAKRLDVADGPTMTRHVLGTPSYMAPEQAQGQSRTVDARTDVYALGAILYELLTGRPPFQGESMVGVLMQVVDEDPLAPRRLLKAVPTDLETICLKCLQKNPAHRYASAEALADDLERYLKEQPILARPAGPWRRLVKWARRRPAAAALVGVSALAFLAALVAGWWFTHRLATQLESTRQARAEAESARHGLKHSLVERVVEGMADDVRQIEAVPQTMAALLARRTDWNEGDLDAWMRSLVGHDERLFGICVALEPGQFIKDRQNFCLYAYRAPGGVTSKHLLPPDYTSPFYRDRPWYAVPKKSGVASWSEPYVEDGAANTPMVTFSVPIVRDGIFAGVVTADLSMDYFRSFHDEMQSIHLGPNTKGMVVSPTGVIIYHPNPRFEFPAAESSLKNIQFSPELQALIKRMETEDTGHDTATDFETGRPAAMHFNRVPSTRWQFLIMETEPDR